MKKEPPKRKKRASLTLSQKELKLHTENAAKIAIRKFNLQRELVYSRTRLEEIQQKIERMIYKRHFRYIYKNYEMEYRFFINTIKSKDIYTAELIKEIEEYNNRIRVVKQTQFDVMDELINMYNNQLKFLYNTYNRMRDIYIKEKIDFIYSLNRRVNKNMVEVDNAKNELIDIIEDNARIIEKNSKIEYGVYKDYYEDKVKTIKSAIESCAIVFWQHLESIIENYKAETTDKKIEMSLLEEQQNINSQNILLLKNQARNVTLQLEFYTENNDRNKLNKIASFNQFERDLNFNSYKILKTKLNELQLEDDKKVNNLSIISNEALQQLQKDFEKNQQLLKCVNLAERYETEYEKVMPIDDVESETMFPKSKEFKQLKIMHKLYYKRTQMAIQNEHLKKVYEAEKDEMEKLKYWIEFVIDNFDVGEPEINEENQTAFNELRNLF